MSSLLPLALSLTHFAPILAKILGGESSERTAEKVVAVAKAVTGVDHAHDVTRALQSNPQALIEFQKAAMDMAIADQQVMFEDRQSARARDVARISSGRSSLRADIMVVCAAVGLMLCLGSLIVFHDLIPGETFGIISTIAGIFGACLKDAYAFEFGSSRGSREKDHQVTALLGHLG